MTPPLAPAHPIACFIDAIAPPALDSCVPAFISNPHLRVVDCRANDVGFALPHFNTRAADEESSLQAKTSAT